jgi:hypothetical protein
MNLLIMSQETIAYYITKSMVLNVILQHPVALCRFDFNFYFVCHLQCLLMFTPLLLIVAYTTHFILIVYHYGSSSPFLMCLAYVS